MEDKKIFDAVIARFQEQYPNRKIETKVSAWGLIVCIDGEERFNATGYNLLYNLTRLCEALERELE